MIYDWFNDYKIREITVQKPAQCGLTDLIVDLIIWISENDPSPVALFLADSDTARKLMKFRIVPALQALGKARVSTDNRDKDVTKYECTLPNGFYLMVSWGSSIAQTASMSFKYVFADEINKPGYDVVKGEGSTLGRIRERMETFPDSKFIKFSTPTLDVGRVTKELNLTDVIYDYQVPCKCCGSFQTLIFGNVVWEGGRTASLEQIEATARYRCPDCGEKWTTAEKNVALSKGVFVPREKVNKVRHVGLQLHRLTSMFNGGRIEEMVSRWLKAHEDGIGEVQNVVNSIFGEPWVQRVSQNQGEAEKSVQLCISNYEKGSVPPSAIALVAGVDVQQDGFWYRIRAVDADLTSYGVTEGYVTTWEELDTIVFAEYSGKKIWRLLIDTGGTKAKDALVSKTEETYEWIRKHQGSGIQIFGAKGSSKNMPTKLKIGAPIEKTPSGKPIPGGMRIIQINTQAFKDALWWRIIEKTPNGEPGSWYLHNATPAYFVKHLTAEEKRIGKDGVATWTRIRKDNHILDCETLCLACFDAEFWGGTKPIKARQAKPAIAAPKLADVPNPYTGGNNYFGGNGGNPYTGGNY